MPVATFSFLLFISATLLVYFTVPRRSQWIVLLVASYVFYASAGVKQLLFLVLTTIISFSAGFLLAGVKNKNKKKFILASALVLDFGLLVFLKYYNFAASGINALLAGTGFALPVFKLLLPLGISFYIFQSAGYVIDVYRGKYPPERNIARFALFVSFFPQIIQGPISRYDRLAPQLSASHEPDFDRLKYGIQLMLWGYLKKIIIADRAAVLVNTVFADYMNYPGSIAALAVLFYCIQIYCDFSGGIDIIRGIAQMMGIDMVENFRRPYFATSLADFWRRWHISLGGWMRDYLFFPLSLSRPFYRLGKRTRRLFPGKLGKIIPTSLASFIVFFVIGIWHGASFKYMAFGLYNGNIISFSIIAAPYFTAFLEKIRIDPQGLPWRIVQIISTNFIVFIGRYFTRGPSLMAALRMLKRTVFSFNMQALRDGTFRTLGLSGFDLFLIVAGCFIIFLVGFYQEAGVEVRKALERKNWLVQWALVMAALAVLVFFGIYREGYIASEFIYQQY
jgi:D-alanyl-lipoteichoic acid acyltransferase DltB (MBOAT superfamily)